MLVIDEKATLAKFQYASIRGLKEHAPVIAVCSNCGGSVEVKKQSVYESNRKGSKGCGNCRNYNRKKHGPKILSARQAGCMERSRDFEIKKPEEKRQPAEINLNVKCKCGCGAMVSKYDPYCDKAKARMAARAHMMGISNFSGSVAA